MGINIAALGLSPEERELQRRNAMQRRIKILFGIAIISLAARLIIKNPPHPKAPDYSKDVLRVMPGMLNNIPAADRAKMSPQLIARIQLAEQTALGKQWSARAPLVPTQPYKPSSAPTTAPDQAEKEKQELFAYVMRKKQEMQKREDMGPIDPTRSTLVRFQSGGWVKVQNAASQEGSMRLRVDRTIVAAVPRSLVRSVQANALNWEEPTPAGFVKLKPAKGITITVAQPISKRITIRKPAYDEI